MPSKGPRGRTCSDEARLWEIIDSTAPESMIAEKFFFPFTVTSMRGTSGRLTFIGSRSLGAPLNRYTFTFASDARYSMCHCFTLIPRSLAIRAQSRLDSKLLDMYSSCERSQAIAA